MIVKQTTRKKMKPGIIILKSMVFYTIKYNIIALFCIVEICRLIGAVDDANSSNESINLKKLDV